MTWSTVSRVLFINYVFPGLQGLYDKMFFCHRADWMWNLNAEMFPYWSDIYTNYHPQALTKRNLWRQRLVAKGF